MRPTLVAYCCPKLLVIASFSPLLLSACAGLYFHDAGPPPSPPPRYSLESWPYQEYWTGIVFNGAKIGFSHNAIDPVERIPDAYELSSESAFRLRFLGINKKINIKTRDRIRDDLTLESFAHSYNLDGHRLRISGQVAGGKLEVAITSGGHTARQQYRFEGPLYPTSILHLYPVLHGLEVGRRYSYFVYDGQTQKIAKVTQEIEAYENSKLFSGRAFRVVTGLHGQKTTTWIGENGKPLLEMAMHGVLISGLESEATAKRYLTIASLNKHDALIDYSLILTEIALERPRAVTSLKVSLDGLPDSIVVPTGVGQNCSEVEGAFVCEIYTIDPSGEGHRMLSAGKTPAELLAPTTTVQSDHPRVRDLARQIVANTADPLGKVQRLLEWIQQNVKRKPVDVFSALDVLDSGKAECQGHALLYAALARAVDIPTRVVNGLTYSKDFQGFLYHSWAESLIGDRWLPVDPTLGQVSADATHIKLLEGETTADLLPLVDIVGKVRARILDYN